MTEKPTSDYIDNLSDLTAPIGDPTHTSLRLACLAHAIAATPRYDDPHDGLPETMLIARRFSRFVIDGTTPNLIKKTDAEMAAGNRAGRKC